MRDLQFEVFSVIRGNCITDASARRGSQKVMEVLEKEVKSEIDGLCAEFQDTFHGDITNPAIGLLLSKLRELSEHLTIKTHTNV